ncbi:unnamed protein product [Paramecium primaurelia]|uniref:Uncharacterized protein n=1 Tax=Paramecium primaurelia TaxID=5886 RepID=A0A8S1MJ10_PARPR|nr:unnamed protein product [Paramecium primaurelia]
MNVQKNFSENFNLELVFPKEVPQELCSFQYYCFENPNIRKIQIQINFTKNQQILYIVDGEIIRIEAIHDLSVKPQILTNLEQIRYLSWIGLYGENQKKVGKWSAYWNGILMVGVGGEYTEEGKKIGLWKEIMDNFQENAQVYQIGEYFNDKKRGLWRYIYNEIDIGGGYYDLQGFKHGLWIDLSDNFCKQQFIYKFFQFQGQLSNLKRSISEWQKGWKMGNQLYEVISWWWIFQSLRLEKWQMD